MQDGKPKKSVERRESTRLQNAAKLLRNLSKGKDLNNADQSSSTAGKIAPSTVSPLSAPLESDRRHHPAYQSEGKGKRRERRTGGGGGGDGSRDQPLGGSGGSRSAMVDRAHSFCGSRDSRKEQRKATAANSAMAAIGDKRWLEKSRSCQRLEDRLLPQLPLLNTETLLAKEGGGGGPVATSKAALGGGGADEAVVVGAKSILLTEDNLAPIEAAKDATQCGRSPDLIQDLPCDLVAHAPSSSSSSPARQQLTTAERSWSLPPVLPPTAAVDCEQRDMVNSNKINSTEETADRLYEVTDSPVSARPVSSVSSVSDEPQADVMMARQRPASVLLGGPLEAPLPSGGAASDEVEAAGGEADTCRSPAANTDMADR